MRSTLSVLRGAQRPRFASAPESDTSAGDEAIALAASAGLILDDWQRYVLREGLGERPDGQWSAFEVCLVVPRQNGKGSVLEALQLAALFSFGERLVLYSAHEFKTAQESFLRILSLIEGAPHLRRQVARVVRSTNESGITLKSGARLRFLARSGGSGRGFSGDRIILDEAYNLPAEAMAALLPTMAARPNPQLWYASSAGMAGSEHLRSVRDRGRLGTSPSLAYFEWSSDADVDLDDPQAWARANPAFDIPLHGVSREFITHEREALGDAEFARERLGLWDESAGMQVIAPGSWNDCLDPESQIAGAPVFALDVSPSQSWSAIAVAGMRGDDVPHVEVASSAAGGVDHRPGTDWVVPRLLQLNERWGDITVTIAAGGAAEFLVPALAQAGIPVDPVKGGDIAAACGLFFSLATTQGLRHRGQPELTSALAAARKAVEDGEGAWRWGRKKSSADITPLYAATLALWSAVAALNKSLDADNNVW